MKRLPWALMLCGCLGPVDAKPSLEGDTDADTDSDSDADTDSDGVEIAIDLTWTVAGDDLDLHLLDSGAATNSAGDCYFVNCKQGNPDGLDWGAPGDDDDPVLLLDDITGAGPEQLSYARPYGAGPFTVSVYDYGVDTADGNSATVEIRIDGRLEETVSFPVVGDEVFYDVARIDGLSGAITVLDP